MTRQEAREQGKGEAQEVGTSAFLRTSWLLWALCSVPWGSSECGNSGCDSLLLGPQWCPPSCECCPHQMETGALASSTFMFPELHAPTQTWRASVSQEGACFLRAAVVICSWKTEHRTQQSCSSLVMLAPANPWPPLLLC